MILYTMNSLTAIYARITKCFITRQQTVKDTDSIDVLKAAVRIVQGEMNV